MTRKHCRCDPFPAACRCCIRAAADVAPSTSRVALAAVERLVHALLYRLQLEGWRWPSPLWRALLTRLASLALMALLTLLARSKATLAGHPLAAAAATAAAAGLRNGRTLRMPAGSTGTDAVVRQLHFGQDHSAADEPSARVSRSTLPRHWDAASESEAPASCVIRDAPQAPWAASPPRAASGG